MIRMFTACIFHSVLFVFAAHCQDLVPNGDFKSINLCEQSYPCAPSAWFNSRKFGGPGYIHPPSKSAGGREFLSMEAVSHRERRDYWETMLLCPLEPGRLYHVSLRISADALIPKRNSVSSIEPDLDDIGFFFT